MNNKKSFNLVLSATFCALVFTMTWIAIPTPSVGNINLGDCMIILTAVILGNSYAIFAGAIGAMLCDLTSGYAIYAPATFVIKALMIALILVMRRYIFKTKKYTSLVIPAICAELIMVLGYFGYEALALGYGIGAVINVPFNLIQGTINLVLAVLIFMMLNKSGITDMISKKEI